MGSCYSATIWFRFHTTNVHDYVCYHKNILIVEFFYLNKLLSLLVVQKNDVKDNKYWHKVSPIGRLNPNKNISASVFKTPHRCALD